MQYRRLGTSDINVPVVSFGAWAIGGWLWGGTDDEAAIRALHAAMDQGISLIDTAPVYGMGHSEVVVGKAIRDRRNQVLIATKCGLRWDCGDGELCLSTLDNHGAPKDIYKNLRPASVRHECEQSLRRLGVEHIDLYQCHWPDVTTPVQDTMAELLQLQREGKIRAIGVSNFSVEQMTAFLECGRIESDQPRYSALDRKIEADILPFCRKNALSVLAYCPLEQGLLTGAVSPDREFAETDQRRHKILFSKENRVKILDLLNRLRPMADACNASFSQLFLAWLIAQEGVTTALAGARTEAQVHENAGAGDLVLSTSDCQTIRDLVTALELTR